MEDNGYTNPEVRNITYKNGKLEGELYQPEKSDEDSTSVPLTDTHKMVYFTNMTHKMIKIAHEHG